MPSKEELCVLASATQVATTGAEFLSPDVEQLVCELKENLRLSAASRKARPAKARPSPYRVPSRSWAEPRAPSHAGPDDPYEMLQALLRDGGLIKEAVRRLQIGLAPKQRCFYDSEEDSRSPVLQICHVDV